VTNKKLLVAAALALVGSIETAWLTITWLVHGHMPCVATARMDCATLFLASGTMPLGLPLTLWGNAAYTSVVLLLLASTWLEGAWAGLARAAFHALAIGMAFFSLLLVALMAVLGAFCPWCLLSAALSVSLGAIAVADIPRTRGWRTRTRSGVGVLLALGMVALMATARRHEPVPPAGSLRRLAAIARHLNASGAHFYGVWWCEACRKQKELFGVAALDLPYVECSRKAPEGVDYFPTWEIAGKRFTGAISPDSLAQLSGFQKAP